VIAFFEVISESAPHIYHSALPLSPQSSIVHKLYELYAHPFTRVVQGMPISWEPAAAMVYNTRGVDTAAWSPCCRFIAVAWGYGSLGVAVLDAATLKTLHTFELPTQKSSDGFSKTQHLSFSPDSHLLICLSGKLKPISGTAIDGEWEYISEQLTSWDLQTGGLVCTILPEPYMSHTQCFSSTYSMDGKMFVAGHRDGNNTTAIISIYNLLSGTHTHSHIVSEGYVVAPIWTHGECLQFVTVNPGLITIWEVGFASTHTPAEVESFLVPNIDHAENFLFLPTCSWLAFTLPEAVLVWDAQNSKLLLNFVGHIKTMYFSSDGCFFACGTADGYPGQRNYLWKESPTGYVPQTLVSIPHSYVGPLLSPDGESIIAIGNPSIQLWHTSDQTYFLSSIQTQPTKQAYFILDFSPDKTLAAVAKLEGDIVTVLNLKSGNTQLTIDTGMTILCLRVTGSTVVVVGKGEVVTWNLPAGDCALRARVNIDNSVQTTIFDNSVLPEDPVVPNISISPDFKYIAVGQVTMGGQPDNGLNIYDGSTGECLAGTTTWGTRPRFTPDGCEVWCDVNHGGWAIVKDSESGLTKLEPLESTMCLSGGIPWQSSCGYEVTDDGWVLNSRGKRLLWLPHYWWSGELDRVWGGQFLGLLDRELPAVVILELDK
jgi:hypothetical protein